MYAEGNSSCRHGRSQGHSQVTDTVTSPRNDEEAAQAAWQQERLLRMNWQPNNHKGH